MQARGGRQSDSPIDFHGIGIEDKQLVGVKHRRHQLAADRCQAERARCFAHARLAVAVHASVRRRTESLLQSQVPEIVDFVPVFPGGELDGVTGLHAGAGQFARAFIETHQHGAALRGFVAVRKFSDVCRKLRPAEHGVETITHQRERDAARCAHVRLGAPDALAVRADRDDGVPRFRVRSREVDVLAIGDRGLRRGLIAEPAAFAIERPPGRTAGVGRGHHVFKFQRLVMDALERVVAGRKNLAPLVAAVPAFHVLTCKPLLVAHQPAQQPAVRSEHSQADVSIVRQFVTSMQRRGLLKFDRGLTGKTFIHTRPPELEGCPPWIAGHRSFAIRGQCGKWDRHLLHVSAAAGQRGKRLSGAGLEDIWFFAFPAVCGQGRLAILCVIPAAKIGHLVFALQAKLHAIAAAESHLLFRQFGVEHRLAIEEANRDVELAVVPGKAGIGRITIPISPGEGSSPAQPRAIPVAELSVGIDGLSSLGNTPARDAGAARGLLNGRRLIPCFTERQFAPPFRPLQIMAARQFLLRGQKIECRVHPCLEAQLQWQRSQQRAIHPAESRFPDQVERPPRHSGNPQ